MKNSHRRRSNQPSAPKGVDTILVPPSELDEYIQDITARRTGGVINLRGMKYQLLYACYRMLSELTHGSEALIQLEGLEDLDVHNTIVVGQAEYIQLKTSVNPMNAGSFWDLGILQNFLEVYRGSPDATFRLVYNMPIASGNLQQLVQHKLSKEALTHWAVKLKGINDSLDISTTQRFLQQITFEYITEAEVQEKCLRALLSNFDIHAASEEQFLKAVFYHAFEWSRQRAVISYQQLASVVQAVKDNYSKAPVNEAIRHNWLERVVYEEELDANTDGYFDGQSARPRHIAQKLPVRRLGWESRVEAELDTAAVVAIRASSGQGKSTLAWQVGYNLQKRGRSIYQLRLCNSQESINAVLDYLQAWVKVGELPVVIVDGLTNQVARWSDLVERAAELPIKFLVTSREEDWYRYGADPATVPVQTVATTLSSQEAENIFQELKSRGKLNENVTLWQPAWEAVADKGLLIEYVYLLTQGQMLGDRLEMQVKELNREQRNAAAKLEILRLVALADCLNLQIDTSRLLRHVQNTVRFDSDRGEVLKQLEREYFLRFGKQRVEGLHPVRSRHLVNLLHETVSLVESMHSVFGLIAAEDTFAFFLAAPEMLEAEDKPEFYAQVASDLTGRSFQEMTNALDGLLRGAALKYWQDNQNVFDSVFETGAIDLFVYQTLPFTKLDTLEQISGMESESLNSVQYLLDWKHKLTPLSLVESDLVLLTTLLHGKLSIQSVFPHYQGIGSLGEWIHRMSLVLPNLVSWDEEYILQELRLKTLTEVEELFRFLWLSDAPRCQAFVKQYKNELLSLLKVRTNTPTIYEEGDELYLEYLLDSEQVDKANSFSVSRLETVSVFLSDYSLYHTKAKMFSFLPEHIHNNVLQNAEKRLSHNTLRSPNEVRINQIWSNTILDIYRAGSIYEWQEYLYRLREAAVEFAKRCVRFLETRLEQNDSRNKSASKAVVEQSELLEKLRQNQPKLNNGNSYEAQEKVINDWLFSLRNFVGQFGGVITPKTDNSRNLATINLTATVQKLESMQTAYDVVSNRFSYFELNTLKSEECAWFRRLLDNVRFYIHCQQIAPTARVYRAKESAKQWAENDTRNRLEQVHAVFHACNTVPNAVFYLPAYLEMDGPLRKAVVGVEGVDFQDTEVMLLLLAGISDLGHLDIDFLTLLPVKDGLASSGLRYGKGVLQHFSAIVSGEPVDELYDWQLPNQVNPDDDLLASLPKIGVRRLEKQDAASELLQLMQDLWQLGEYRQRLSPDSVIEHQWLQELEQNTQNKAKSHLSIIKPNISGYAFNTLSECVNECLNQENTIQPSHLLSVMNDLVISEFA